MLNITEMESEPQNIEKNFEFLWRISVLHIIGSVWHMSACSSEMCLDEVAHSPPNLH